MQLELNWQQHLPTCGLLARLPYNAKPPVKSTIQGQVLPHAG